MDSQECCAANIWAVAANRLKEQNEHLFRQWFQKITPLKQEGETLTLGVSDDFFASIIEDQYADLLTEALSDIDGKNYGYRLEPGHEPVQEEPAPATAGATAETAQKKNNAIRKIINQQNTLSEHTFETFIVDTENGCGYSAARAVADAPGKRYNPLYLYGVSGVGKTHLLQSIGNYIDEHNPKMKIIYVTAESFTNEFINSLLTDKASAFKIKYRSVDVLLIDDIHFLQKKNQIQEELFHTFNELYDNHKQIVLTCDRPITELTDITDRLKTRFRKGLNVDLQPPAYETRMAIAIQKCRERNYKLDNDVLEFICQSIDTNIRDLEGALTTLSSFSELVGKPITLDIAKEHLKNFIVEPAIKNNDISIDAIIRKTASYFNIKEYDIKGKSRNKNIILARHISIYLSSKLTSYSLSEIGKMMNGKDHTTIMHSVERIKSLLDTDESVRNAVSSIEKSLLE